MSANRIASSLRREITRGTISPGDRLPPERELAATFSVARGTVRGAIKQLEREGLVETRVGSGTYAVGSSIEAVNEVIGNASPLELIDARFALEPHICRLAVLNARDRDFQALGELLDQMEDACDDAIGFSELDTAFHSLLAQTTGNTLLIWVVSQINSVRNQEQWSLMRQLTLNSSTIQQYNVQHRQIVNAVRAREPERAAELMKKHLESARLSLTRSVAT